MDDFQDLMIKQHELSTKHGKVGHFDLLVSNGDLALSSVKNSSVEMQIIHDDRGIEQGLEQLKQIYGAEALKGISDTELYNLYKRHQASAK